MADINSINQVGKHEDLSDRLVVADAKNTPLTSMMKKGKKPVNTLYTWPVGGIPAPDTTPVPDGKPVDNIEDGSGNRQILSGRVQKIRRTVGVSEMAEDVNHPAGVASEYKAAKANMLLAVKRAIEAIFGSTQDSNLTGTTYQTRGFLEWLSPTAQTDLPVNPAYLTPASSVYTGTFANITEDSLRAIMQSIYQQTGQMGSWTGVFGPDLKSAVSKMTVTEPTVGGQTLVRTFFAKLGSKLECVVDIVRGDFGQINVHPSLWLGWNNTTKVPATKKGLILDMDFIEMNANKLPAHYPLPFDDSGPRGVITAIVGGKMLNPLQHGAINPSDS
jgi:hypothetical protein